MRHNSACTLREPARCSNYSRSHSAFETSDLKSSLHSKQQCSKRPTSRQWTSWTVTDPSSDQDSRSISAQPLRTRGNSDVTSPLSESDQTSKHYSHVRTTSLSKRSIPQSLAHQESASFSSSLENLKALPTRTKNAYGPETNKQTNCLGEEHRTRSAVGPPVEPVGHVAVTLGRPAPAIEVNVARSRCHPRRRPCADAVQAPAPKLRRDTDCTEAIVRLIVFFSTKLVHTIWSQASATPKSSKDFNGAAVLPLQVFIQETLRRSKTSYSTLQVALFYLILLRPHVKPCQASQQQYTPGCRALQCGRRMFLTALILASKYLQDRNYSARAWSKISGLPVAEINENERHYLELIKYNLHMSKDAFENWSKVVLSICKASGQARSGDKTDSPPSSPDGLSISSDFERPGSSGWWSYHLMRLAPDVVKNTRATEEYLAGLAMNTPFVASNLSLDTPPSSPESLEEILAGHSSPVVAPSMGSTSVAETPRLGESAAPIGAVPSRPLPANLPTPQTTPRHDSAFNFSRRPSHSDLRCRASLQALVGVDRQAVNVANLESCPPPKPRIPSSGICGNSHPLRESAESSTLSWMSSPESAYSDSSSYTASTRSRSSSVSSISSVWSVPGLCARQNDAMPMSGTRAECQTVSNGMAQHNRSNIGSYSFYHPVSNMHSIPEDARACGKLSSVNVRASSQMSVSDSDKFRSDSCDFGDHQVNQSLESLSSQSDEKVQAHADPAVIRKPTEKVVEQLRNESPKKHKRSRSSKEDCILQNEVRQFLWNEQVQVCVEDDKRPTTYVETSDKQAQFPLQQWAHAKKPVPNALHNKRIALQHSSSSEPTNAPEMATKFLRPSVAVV